MTNGTGIASETGGKSGDNAANSNEDIYEKMRQKVQNTRIALSKQGARFELPIDMKSLEGKKPKDYLQERCHVTKRRENLYKKHFMNYDKDKDQKLNLKEVEKAMKDVFVDTIDTKTIEDVCFLVDLNNDDLVPLAVFAPMCALSERVMHHKYSTGEASLDPLYSEKDHLEEADFSCLSWKLNGISIEPKLHNLLYVILDPVLYLPKSLSQSVPSMAASEAEEEAQQEEKEIVDDNHNVVEEEKLPSETQSTHKEVVDEAPPNNDLNEQ